MASIATGSDSYIAIQDQDPTSWATPQPGGATYTFHEHHAGGFEEANEPQFSSEARNAGARFGRVNEIGVSGSFPMDWKHKGFEKLMLNVFELLSNAEEASFQIGTSNNKIDFQEVPDGPELTATIPSATYTSTTLCAAIKAQMEAAGSGATYTVTYDPDTKLFSFDCDTYLNLLFNTGSNVLTSSGPYVGFDETDIANVASPIDIESDQEADVQDHGFTVTASNHSIDFRESAGGTIYEATLAHGTFNSADICADIKAKMEAANASAVVYTVTYSVGSRHFTIASDGSYLQLMFAAGPNAPTDAGALLGYSGSPIDSSAPISLESTLQAEVSEHYFDITPTNKYIDFKEVSGGGELNAALTEDGGLTSGEVCDRIVSSMEAAGAGLYIATYDISNAHFTIRSSLEYLSLLWTSGTNTANSAANLLGFTGADVTDTASFTPIESQNETLAYYANVFAIPEDLDLTDLQPDGMTFYAHKNQQTDLVENVFAQALAWAMNGNFLTLTATLAAKKVSVAPGSPITPTFSSELPAVVKGALSVTINDTGNGGLEYSSVNTKGLTINCPRPITMLMNDASSYAVDAAGGDKIKPEVSFSWFRNNRTTLDTVMDTRWRSGAPIAATFTLTSAVPLRTGGTIYPSTTWFFPALMRKGGSSKVAGPGPIEQPYAWVAEVGPNGEPPMTLTLRNSTYLG